MSESYAASSGEHSNQPPQFLTIEPREIAAANQLSEEALTFSTRDEISWMLDYGRQYERFYVARKMTAQGYPCVLGAKIEGTNDDEPLTTTRYSLDTVTGHFIVTSERFDNVDSYYNPDTDTSKADLMLMRMGMFYPTEKDWHDFMSILTTGKNIADEMTVKLAMTELIGPSVMDEPTREPDTL